MYVTWQKKLSKFRYGRINNFEWSKEDERYIYMQLLLIHVNWVFTQWFFLTNKYFYVVGLDDKIDNDPLVILRKTYVDRISLSLL